MEEMNTGAVATTESIFGGSNNSAEQTVEMPEPATVFGFAPEEPEAAAPEEAPEQTSEEPADANTGEQEQKDAADPAPRTRKNPYAEQRRALMEQFRKDPARIVGERILKSRMKRDGVDRNTAFRTVTDSLDEAEAKQLNIEPEQYRFMQKVSDKLGLDDDPTDEAYAWEQPEEPQKDAEEPEPVEEKARRIIEDLKRVHLPNGFDLDAAMQDRAFVDLLEEYPAAAAVRVYHAEHMAPQQVADRLRARQGVPASTRPQAAVRPEPNYREMSSEDFFKMKERVAKSIY